MIDNHVKENIMGWDDKFQKIITYDIERINEFNFSDLTKEFLSRVGLPKAAAPFLSFVENNNVQDEGILKLTDYFEFLEPAFEKYVVIGSNGSGDEIVIDTMDNCKVKLLDHEDYFSEYFMNSSIAKLFSSLIIYRDFIDCVLKENGEDAVIESRFSNAQLNDLKQRLTNNDPDSMLDNCFWFQEIEILIANRNENN